jgi:hypothetical protein
MVLFGRSNLWPEVAKKASPGFTLGNLPQPALALKGPLAPRESAPNSEPGGLCISGPFRAKSLFSANPG